ncbi:MAG TPA: hypothetical protein VGL10_05030 [Gammaproteobacteria bacterium]
MIRNILSTLAGIAAAIVVIVLIEAAGHALYPPPVGLDFNNSVTLAAYIGAMPRPVFMFVLLAWMGGAFTGSAVAAMMARSRSCIYPLIITLTVLLAAVSNMLRIPHPMWFMVSAVVMIPLAGYLACALLARCAKSCIKTDVHR